MRTTQFLLSLALAVLVVSRVGSIPLEAEGNYGIGNPEAFLSRYLTYRAQQLASSSPDVMKIRLGHVKGLSKTFVAMVGEMAVNLRSGTFRVSLNGLTAGQTYSVWLVDSAEAGAVSPRPDNVFRLATLVAQGPSTVLTGGLGPNLPPGFAIDRVVVAPGTTSTAEPLAAGTLLPMPPAEMTGWSGDGAPGTGSLREFAIGAVTQHFTLNLQRVAGRDFRLPNDAELDAMEAFQLSLGRDEDLDLTKITFNDPGVARGEQIFVNGTGNPLAGGTCTACHDNAGANSPPILLQNRNFDTNVEDVVHPARGVEPFPKDGGFGRMASLDGTRFGNDTFNAAPVVEAADTPPFFHNNVVETLEGVVRFYGGPEFNAGRPFLIQFSFDDTQVRDVANFMRGINSIQNINVAERELQEFVGLTVNTGREGDTRLQTASEDIQDTIDVLGEGGIFPAAVPILVSARTLVAQARQSGDPALRRTFAQQAIAKLRQARNTMAVITP